MIPRYLKASLARIFNISSGRRNQCALLESYYCGNGFNGNLFSFSLVLPKEGHMNIPACCTESFLYPIAEDGVCFNFGTEPLRDTNNVNGAIGEFMHSDSSLQLVYLRVKEGKSYKGRAGMIFDEDNNPLMIPYYEVNIANGNGTFSPKIWLNPSIFNSSYPLEKALVKLIIPHFTDTDSDTYVLVSMRNYEETRDYNGSSRIEIVISRECPIKFNFPTTPTPSLLSDNNVKEFLKANAEN